MFHKVPWELSSWQSLNVGREWKGHAILVTTRSLHSQTLFGPCKIEVAWWRIDELIKTSESDFVNEAWTSFLGMWPFVALEINLMFVTKVTLSKAFKKKEGKHMGIIC